MEPSKSSLSHPRRYLGLDLAGAKNPKTALAALEYYPREGKIFLLDIYDRIASEEDHSSDETLLEVIQELNVGVGAMGVNVPLEMPPCVSCSRKSCPLPQKCTVSEVKWMRDLSKRAAKNPELEIRVKEFTPYTQRPIELWLRYQVFPKLPDWARFEIDETLGGNRAPLTARMGFLKRHLKGVPLVETWPKLTLGVLGKELEIPKRLISTYRHLEQGAHARQEILELFSKRLGIFIYERDVRKLAQSLTAFDALICAYTALLSDQGACARAPHGFPEASGWVQYPKI